MICGRRSARWPWRGVTWSRSNAVLERRVSERTLELAETVERLRRMNLELQELGRLKSEFVTLVSHELRAPLTNIRAGIELTAGGTNPEVDAAAQERLALVAAETERLARFVEAILDLSALEAGRFPLRPGPADLGAAAGRVADRLRVQQGGDRIVLDLPEGIPAVLADERGLESVFFHLLDNALKYAPASEIRVQAQAKAAGVAVSVTDHGPGIPVDERERVFEMFHRLDAARFARCVWSRPGAAPDTPACGGDGRLASVPNRPRGEAHAWSSGSRRPPARRDRSGIRLRRGAVAPVL